MMMRMMILYSIDFPNMFSSSSTNLVKDHEATMNNIKTILLSSKYSLLGDPDFGSLLKRRLFEQNDIVLKDLVIDDIYSTILTFIPQVAIKREDIDIESDGIDLIATIKALNLIDSQPDLFKINLTTEGLE